MSGDAKVTSNNSDQEKLAGALGTIIEVLVGRELEAMRASLGDLDSTLSKRIKGLKKDTTEVIDGLMSDLSTRIDDLLAKLGEAEDRQKSAISDIEERNRKANDDLQQRLTEAQSKTADRMGEMQSRFENDLLGQEQKLMGELGALGQSLASVQGELHQQKEHATRTSGLLTNMASVLGGGQPGPGVPVVTPTTVDPIPLVTPEKQASEHQPSAEDEPGNGHGSEEGLDSAIDRVLGGD
jgi:hypothetical protein